MQPGNRSFVGEFAWDFIRASSIDEPLTGGGIWLPEAGPLSLLRSEIDRHSHRLKNLLMAADIRKEFLGGVKKDEKAVVKAFVDNNQEYILKTKPKVRWTARSWLMHMFHSAKRRTPLSSRVSNRVTPVITPILTC